MCPALDDITYGQVEVTGTRQGDKANYFCNYGFYLSGNKQRVCQIDGSWSGAEPRCVRKSDALSVCTLALIISGVGEGGGGSAPHSF